MNKKKIPLYILITLIILIALHYISLNISYQLNKKTFTESIPVYGNKNNYVPQGLTYSKKYNIILQTSHNKKKTSMLYVIDFDTGNLLKELEIKDEEGNEYHKHVGGITTDDDKVWITNEYTISEFNLSDIVNTENNYIQSKKDLKSITRGDFCYYQDNTLYVGDYYLKYYMNVKNDTPLLIAYDSSNLENIKKVITIPGRIQGMTMLEDGTIVFTKSFSNFLKSDLSFYNNNINQETQEFYEINNQKIPYYHITKNDLKKNVKLSPMAENLFYKDNSLYILYENSTDAFKFTYPKIRNIIKYNIEKQP